MMTFGSLVAGGLAFAFGFLAGRHDLRRRDSFSIWTEMTHLLKRIQDLEYRLDRSGR